MTDPDNDSADDERSLFAKILRRSADELEQPDEGEPDGDPDVETRADDEDEDDDNGGDDSESVDPVDRALSEGTIEAAQASKLREVTERMDGPGVQTLVDAISENDLDVDEAVEMIEAVNGDDPMDGPEMDSEPEELKARGEGEEPADEADATGPTDEEIAELRAKLETVDELADLPDRLDDIEQRLEELPTADEVDEQVEQRLEAVGEELDEEFEDLIQRAEVVGSPQPKSGSSDDGPTVRESLGLTGGD